MVGLPKMIVCLMSKAIIIGSQGRRLDVFKSPTTRILSKQSPDPSLARAEMMSRRLRVRATLERRRTPPVAT